MVKLFLSQDSVAALRNGGYPGPVMHNLATGETRLCIRSDQDRALLAKILPHAEPRIIPGTVVGDEGTVTKAFGGRV